MSVGGFITLFDFAVEQLERAHVKGVLDKYVSSNVANLVVNQGDSFEQALRGVTKPVSVLFSDIRGFTTLSESRSPETLVSQLNEYFLQMVDKVLLEGGTLQKFIGDAIMAVWGDTHSLGLTQDCSHAMKAALKMRTALAELNAGWAGRDDRLELSIGVGINHGTVVVGELGHPQRMEFTVLGDGVNLAARLESATKQFGCDILVGETAYAITKDEFVFRRVDRAVFKGKTQPIHVFTPLGEAGMEVPGWLTRYHAALDLFYEQKFAQAKEKLAEVNTEMGGDDYLCLMYKKRCDHFLSEPPEADWDGRWVLSEK
jgi:adenylate cyclase